VMVATPNAVSNTVNFTSDKKRRGHLTTLD
jgi:hypothetical protein